MVKVFSGTGKISAAKSFADVAVRAQSALGDDDLTSSVHVAIKAAKLNDKLGAFNNELMLTQTHLLTSVCPIFLTMVLML